MATKKVSLKEFNNMVTKMVRQELKKALNEDTEVDIMDTIPDAKSTTDDKTQNALNPNLRKVRDKAAMAAWVMRQYFDPAKHSSKIWFDRSVDEDNVLEYISEPFNNFPLTPKEIADLWKLKSSLKSSMKTISKDLDAVPDDVPEKPKTGTYQTGEVTLKDIGDSLGGLTPTMINKLVSSGMEKIKSMTGGRTPTSMDSDQLDDLMNKIALARVDTAKDFAKRLRASGGDVEAFINQMHQENILSSSELDFIGEQERSALEDLAEMPPERIVKILLADIEKDNNLFKSFQTAVSKRVFPPARRGRPRKED